MFFNAISNAQQLPPLKREIKDLPEIKWGDFLCHSVDQTSVAQTRRTTYLELDGAKLSFGIRGDVTREDRKIFIEKVFQDVVLNCPKETPLAFISLGSEFLLKEYILGKSLIEAGFKNITFLLVDPMYLLVKDSDEAQQVFRNFRDLIESAYLKAYSADFASSCSIKYLSRAQNIEKYFPMNANVIVLESIPTYTQNLITLKKHGVQEPDLKDCLFGGCITSCSAASAITFVPINLINFFTEQGATFKGPLPLGVFQDPQTQLKYYVEWGCKIQTDGTFHLIFKGDAHWKKSLKGFEDETPIQLGASSVTFGEMLPRAKQLLTQILKEKIQEFKGSDSQKTLTQENRSKLLEILQETAMSCLPVSCFFIADYHTDRQEALEWIKMRAGHNYRKIFSLKIGIDRPETSIEQIK